MKILIIIVILAIILSIIAFILVAKKTKVVQVKKNKQIEKVIDFDDLMAIAKNPNSSSEQLLKAFNLFNEDFVINDENSHKYIIFLSRILTHKNVDKEIFRYFHKEIKSKNRYYKKELEVIEKTALR